jgi:arylsulfatase A-like enzyme
MAAGNGHRRRGLYSLLIGALFAALAAAGTMNSYAAPGPGSSGRVPNVLFIVTDDQRIETLDVMPRTKRLFDDQGTSFPNAYATTPLCCPARASILSGRYAHNNGVRDNTQAAKLDQGSTITRRLRDAGYTTGIFGKFLNSWPLADNPPHFDRWATFKNGPYSGFQANEQGQIRTIDQYATTYVARKATQFINQAERNDQRPWFLYVAPTAPHSPFTPESQYANADVPEFVPNPAFFEKDRSDKPPGVRNTFLDPAVVLAHRRAQLRMLMSVDDLVSKIFSSLKSNQEVDGQNEETLAVFVSDNGFMWGEHGLEGKDRPYTYAAKIPLYLRWPGRINAGVDDPRIVANIDLVPTVLEGTNIQSETPMDGESLLGGHSRDRILLERLLASGRLFWVSTRTASYQYTEYYRASDPPDAPPFFREYYDLVADPWQLTNYLADGDPLNDPPPPTLDALHNQLMSDLSCAGHGEVEGRPACP